MPCRQHSGIGRGRRRMGRTAKTPPPAAKVVRMSTAAALSGADRLPPPPRPIADSRLTRIARVLFAAFMAFVLAGTLFGVVSAFVQQQRAAERQQAAGTVVQKDEIPTRRSSRRVLHYQFTLDGKPYPNTAEVSQEVFDGTALG